MSKSKSVLETADLVFGDKVQAILDGFNGDEVTNAYLERLTSVVKEARETLMKFVAELEFMDLGPVVLFDKLHQACRRGFEHVHEYAYMIDDNGLLPLKRETAISSALREAKTGQLIFEDLEEGMWVCYLKPHGTAEIGRVKSWNDKYVFVVYQCSGNWDRYEDYTGCATNISDLMEIDRFTVS